MQTYPCRTVLIVWGMSACLLASSYHLQHLQSPVCTLCSPVYAPQTTCTPTIRSLAMTSLSLDPYPGLSQQLRARFYAPSTLEFDLQIGCLTGIFGLCLVLVLASLGIRYWRRTFWIFATRKTVAGTWIVPHPIVTWTIMLGVMFTREFGAEGELTRRGDGRY